MYEWLRDYIQLQQEIDYLTFRVEQNERELKRWVEGDLQKVRLTKESIASSLEEKIIDDRLLIAEKECRMDKLKTLVCTFQGLDHQILYKKYCEGKTLEMIAEELGYSASHIKKKHAELVRTIKFVEKFTLSSL